MSTRTRSSLATLAALVVAAAVGAAPARAADVGRRFEASLQGGVQVLNENDSTLPGTVVNVPVVGTFGYHLSRVFAVEGEFGWIIPVTQEIEDGSGTGGGDQKTPNILTYQGSVLAKLPTANSRFTPYLAAGAGAITFLEDDGGDRVPRLASSETAFALNFGVGTTVELGRSWALRADFREFVGFPGDADAPGTGLAQFAPTAETDTFWMERGTLGLAYRF